MPYSGGGSDTFPWGSGCVSVRRGVWPRLLKGPRHGREPGRAQTAAVRMAEKILVTGGAGYIGSHCVLELVEAGYIPVVIDNFHNAIRGGDALPESLRRVQEIVGKKILFQELDILDEAALRELFQKHHFSAVMHFAGLKAVGESVQKPLEYYKVNLTGTIRLLETMKAHGVRDIVFSSSATVYGDPAYLPLDENHPVGGCTNPYGKSKYFIEEMIQDLCKAEKDWNAILLRYFNPIGAHESGRIGEDPQGIPNNLMPYVAQVAVGRREYLSVFGDDYKTADGTGVRDYIHVVDLAKGHIAALKKLKENCGCKIYNLGTGCGYSVLQMVKAMEKASGREIKYKITARREGDIAACYADPALAEQELGWKAAFGLDKMCEDLWRWQVQNPTGFSNN
uniref:UDP-glucose 4-epimerase n=2 Tax=Gopherus agassizii TaxID=38772 RepID=A0A452GWW5_9SAUR